MVRKVDVDKNDLFQELYTGYPHVYNSYDNKAHLTYPQYPPPYYDYCSLFILWIIRSVRQT